MASFQLVAEDSDMLGFIQSNQSIINTTPPINDNWIKIKSTNSNPNFTITQSKNISFGDQVAVAWNFSDFLSINLSVYEKIVSPSIDGVLHPSKNRFNKATEHYNNSASTNYSVANKNLFGYKLGLSSILGLGNNYKLNINFDYGQLGDNKFSDVNRDEIDTSSFALGIRKSRFGASVNTDVFIEDNIGLFENSRIGFELDWHFNDDTTLSFGRKQSLSEKSDSLDSITGNVQYIKFQHNL